MRSVYDKTGCIKLVRCNRYIIHSPTYVVREEGKDQGQAVIGLQVQGKFQW